MVRIEARVGDGWSGRLDRYVADELGTVSRSQFKARFASATVNGKDAKPSRELKAGDAVVVELRDEEDRSERAESIPLSVLYEDGDAIVVDKPQGMVTHPAHGNWSGTLGNALLGRAAEGARRGGPEGARPSRAGIVHRLDKDTSGVIIAAKNARAQEFLSAQFRERTTVKTYLAIVKGRPRATAGAVGQDSGHIDTWLARDPKDRKRFSVSPEGRGKRAVSDWKVLSEANGYCLVALRPKTGRTHQLRVHMRHAGCPIVGDPLYGRPDPRLPGATLMLHARELRIRLPGAAAVSRFVAPVPERFLKAMKALGLSSRSPSVPSSQTGLA